MRYDDPNDRDRRSRDAGKSRHRGRRRGAAHHNPFSTPNFTEKREAQCEVCKTVATFFRRKGGRPPSPGHRKHMHCFKCGVLRPHRELPAREET